MIDVDYIYQFILKQIQKSQSGGLSATQFQYYWNDAQSAYMDDLLGRFQRGSNTKEGMGNTGLIENETVLTKLAPFIQNVPLTIAGGTCAKPSDLLYTL